MFALVRVRLLVCHICLLLVLIAPAEAAPLSEPSSPAKASTTQSVDLSSPALFPAAISTVPANIQAPPSIAGLMHDMWLASPTFRRQCARIAGAAGSRVDIVLRKPRSAEVRATSQIDHPMAGKWIATVEVSINHDIVELIAHEFEHVIEQLDGVDLPRLAQQGLDGVVTGSGERYETARADATGKRVAREYKNRQREAS